MCLLVHVEYLWKITGWGGEGKLRIEKGTKEGEGLWTPFCFVSDFTMHVLRNENSTLPEW